jgi:hypothetical protein
LPHTDKNLLAHLPPDDFDLFSQMRVAFARMVATTRHPPWVTDDAASAVGDGRIGQGATAAESLGRQSGVRVTRRGEPPALLLEVSDGIETVLEGTGHERHGNSRRQISL